MVKLRYGYLFIGIVIGFILLFQFVVSLMDRRLVVTFCDVGQGDSAYLRFPDGRDMLIDGGPSAKVLRCLGKAMPFWDRQIDAVVLTHPDLDHFGGLIDVAKRYRIGVFLYNGQENPAPRYQELREILAQRGATIRVVAEGDILTIGDVRARVLWPSRDIAFNTLGASSDEKSSSRVDRNDYGIVLHVRYGMFDAVFPADIDERAQSELAEHLLFSDTIEVFKVPHHGAKTSITDALLSIVRPMIAVISVGANNRFGHPASETIEALIQKGSKILRTDQNGSIIVRTDGKKVTIQTEKARNKKIQ